MGTIQTSESFDGSGIFRCSPLQLVCRHKMNYANKIMLKE